MLRLFLCCASIYLAGVALTPAEAGSGQEGSVLSQTVSEERLAQSYRLVWETREKTGPIRISTDLTRVYGVPIHRERTIVDAKGYTADAPVRPYSLTAGMSLRSALELLADTWPERVRWSVVENAVILAETGEDEHASLLDARVTLAVKKASLWEAVRTLGEALVDANPDSRKLVFNLPGLGHGMRPPEEFLVTGLIDFACQDMVARDALCRILKLAPFLVTYSYYHSRRFWSNEDEDGALISLSSFEVPEEIRGHRLKRPSKSERMMTWEETLEWTRKTHVGHEPDWLQRQNCKTP